MKNHEEIKYYCAFSYLFIKPLIKSKIFEYFDYDIKKAFEANEKDIQKFSEECNITMPKTYFENKAKLNPDECAKNAFLDKEVKIITYKDEQYPPLLRQIPDFPLSLYYMGNLDNIDYNFNIAIVGSRNASSSAKFALNDIISKFRNSNITIVSGLAYGIDTQAHKSAIENNIKTIAVVGSGLDIVYPSINKELFCKIKNECGAVFSEYPLKTRPAAQNFPQRNRIVVGMSKGTLIAEAQMRSGAMISANLTFDYNRELMCIPGDIFNPNTEGVYHLIKNGASIVTCANDLLNYTGWDIILSEDKKYEDDLNENQKRIFDIISMEPKTLDKIAQEAKEDVSKIMVILTELELKSLIKQSNNKYYKIQQV